MAAYRLTDPAPVFPNLLGTARAANGSLTFYEKGTTTLKDTWSDQALTIDNDNPVPLDSSGRAETEIWLDGEYTVVAKAADGSPIWTRVVAPEIAPGLAIPDLTGKTGWFLSNNGSVLVWQDILALLLPDPTGSAGFQVVVNADGTGYVLQPIEEPPTPEEPVTNNPTSVRLGTLLIQWGSGTVPAAPTVKTNAVNITFPTAFTGNAVIVSPINKTPGGSTSSGACAVLCASAYSATGATITANIPDDDSNSNWKLGNATNFDYIAIGPTTEP